MVDQMRGQRSTFCRPSRANSFSDPFRRFTTGYVRLSLPDTSRTTAPSHEAKIRPAAKHWDFSVWDSW